MTAPPYLEQVRVLQQALDEPIWEQALIEPTQLKQQIQTVKELYTQYQWLSQPDVVEENLAQRFRSIVVEIDKQLRLLEIDGLFLQNARQAATQTQRRDQIRDRLVLLNRYCEALLQL
ncbi:MAG TPA: heterocyst frequency control protein PatD [Leptolyngbyaceae cyanobacterium M33_DOE_097]|uniref:Heterocyst frequency control protein PatD n=1 Tax=Oscillatoriales cyanobacterium SpSt-418 TaxID=2282169 RepID=A0A7C3PG71_9CYAN|nr:heterocyst frequency control protein PatD [Leptolyngbyaceae cyanobacterium M33_DOE_097]